jgi:hypothetical protein
MFNTGEEVTSERLRMGDVLQTVNKYAEYSAVVQLIECNITSHMIQRRH